MNIPAHLFSGSSCLLMHALTRFIDELFLQIKESKSLTACRAMFLHPFLLSSLLFIYDNLLFIDGSFIWSFYLDILVSNT